MNLFPNKESGSISTLTVLGIVGICMMFMFQLNKRSQNEFSYELHSEIVSHRNAVIRKIEDLAVCGKLEQNCTRGMTYDVESRLGGPLLVKRDGSTVISSLNVLIRCEDFKHKDNKVDKSLVVNVARRDKAGNFLSDPLTPSRKGEWTPLDLSLAEICNGDSGVETVIEEATCYGGKNEAVGQQRNGYELPEDIRMQFCSDPGCKKLRSYCNENLSEFNYKDCRAGYKPTFKYLDRYGWAGVDFSKYTVCEKVNP
ncbi:hypothetical protein EON80_05835 [bacterium]|nr:MAG: hypothetical protein EON80_05835 [bacterium]